MLVQVSVENFHRHLFCNLFTNSINPNLFLVGDWFGFTVFIQYPNFQYQVINATRQGGFAPCLVLL